MFNNIENLQYQMQFVNVNHRKAIFSDSVPYLFLQLSALVLLHEKLLVGVLARDGYTETCGINPNTNLFGLTKE